MDLKPIDKNSEFPQDPSDAIPNVGDHVVNLDDGTTGIVSKRTFEYRNGRLSNVKLFFTES